MSSGTVDEGAGRVLEVVIVNGSPSENSKTVALAQLVADNLAEILPVHVRTVDVYRLGAGFTGALSRDDVTPPVEAALREVETADIVIPAIPVFRGAYPGMFKHFFDLIEQYSLANTLVLMVATGGSDRHALVLEHVLRPLFGFFQALVAPVGFYAKAADFDGTIVLNNEVYSRIAIGLADIADILKARALRPAPQGNQAAVP